MRWDDNDKWILSLPQRVSSHVMLSCELNHSPRLGHKHYQHEWSTVEATADASCFSLPRRTLQFTAMLVCPITFEPLKMGRSCIEMPIIPKWLIKLSQSKCWQLVDKLAPLVCLCRCFEPAPAGATASSSAVRSRGILPSCVYSHW